MTDAAEKRARAFRALSMTAHWAVAREALIERYAEIRASLLPDTDGSRLNRAVGKMEELEWVLAMFGEAAYGGLPLADGTPVREGGPGGAWCAPGIAEGYPGGSGSPAALGIPE